MDFIPNMSRSILETRRERWGVLITGNYLSPAGDIGQSCNKPDVPILFGMDNLRYLTIVRFHHRPLSASIGDESYLSPYCRRSRA